MKLIPSRLSLFSAAALLLVGCAGKHEIQGAIIDRNGEPMDRVIVSLDPGGVELVTDSAGQFSIDYLRDEAGERVKLDKKTDYTIEAFRTGFHVQRMDFYFKRGLLVLEPMTMKEDTIILKPGEEDIDPANFEDRTHSAGSNYEGE